MSLGLFCNDLIMSGQVERFDDGPLMVEVQSFADGLPVDGDVHEPDTRPAIAGTWEPRCAMPRRKSP